MRKLLAILLFATPLAAQLERPVVVRLPGMEDVDVRKNIAYDGALKLDLYRPRNAGGVLPLVIFLNGVGRPDLKEWGQYTSWPRLAAMRGMAAIAHETSGNAGEVAAQTEALLKSVSANAAEWKIDPARIAIWACSANARLGTALLANRADLRGAVFYYGLMEAAPKNIGTPVFVARAGLDAPNLNASIDRWVAQAVAMEVPVMLVTYPEGVHGFELDQDTPESRQIVTQTLDFLHFHLTTAPTPRKEPMTLAQLQRLITEQGTEKALAKVKELRASHPDAHVVREATLNGLGYSLLAERKLAEATAAFAAVVAAYPESPNAHDSLADAHEAAGRKAEAIASSERALALLDKAGERLHPQQREGIRRSAEERLKRLR
jgi:dienelactone hydrolase